MLLLPLVAIAFTVPPLAPDVVRGFDHFYNLEYEEAVGEFRKAVAADPKDPQRENHLAQAILYRAMLKAGALESELVSGNNAFVRRERVNPSAAEQAEFDRAIQQAMEKAQRLLAAEAKSSDALYSLAVSHGLRANYNFLVRKAWIDSLKDASAARKNAQAAVEADKNYIDAYLLLGVYDYVAGSLPMGYRMLGFIAGFRGDREGGIRQLERVAREGVNNRMDARILLAAIYRREKKPEKAVPLLEYLIQALPRNYLMRLELAQMFGDLGEREKALATIDEVAALQSKGAAGYQRLVAEKIAYLKGNLLFWFDDYVRAVPELERAAAAHEKLDLNTALLACLRLGQTQDLLDRHVEAVKAYRMAVQIAPESEYAKEASRYIGRAYKRPRIG